jgi:hypothetical protein
LSRDPGIITISSFLVEVEKIIPFHKILITAALASLKVGFSFLYQALSLLAVYPAASGN